MAAVDTKILLESGTNEIEIMEFTIAGDLFGINVAKVREILMPSAIKPMPQSHPAVEGVFKPRDRVITVVNLPKYLGLPKSSENGRDLFIITNFNKVYVAFRVHSVEGIDRISWSSIQKPDKTIYGGDSGVATGLAECGNRLVTILDFEKIVADIAPETGIQLSGIDKLQRKDRDQRPIIVAEDSILLSKMIEEALVKAGYNNVLMFNNGQEAWDYLSEIRDDAHIYDKVSCIITDIEMPQMDGHRLTKLVKTDAVLKKIPLVIFSSLINEEMQIKGKSLGADEQLSKPEIVHLVTVIDHLLDKSTDIKS
ncbi:chemotaxis protein [Sinanaerobacter sp. ZZT-01]|uniref:chemotaxis protein n=1 Tax=Sinanaerobacter sp. ZZT-01 TaxID=3111540 RepID=UPI002D79C234|nr:chemotaxis protein [Sinanaerobacter sp. ZZT-01]WRR93559.1 chemotaxis protein [Sinanaerobacter sp. ZZT-01]